MHQNGAQSRFWWRSADNRPTAHTLDQLDGHAAGVHSFEPARVAAPVAAPIAPIAGTFGIQAAPSPQFALVLQPLAAKQRRRPARRPVLTLLAASFVGAVVFVAGSGFGRSVRLADPLNVQFDRALVAAGFGINEVTLSGNRYATDTEIYAALGLDHAGSVIRYDVNAARLRVEALPWVKTATIARLLPDRLNIKIEERLPAAVWSHAGRTALVDRTGRTLANLTGPSAVSLPKIGGAGAPEALGGLLAALELHGDIAGQVEIARRVSLRRWTLELQGGVTVHLPADREAEALGRLGRQQQAGAILGKPNQIIDLRQDRVIAIRPTTSRGAAIAPPAARSTL